MYQFRRRERAEGREKTKILLLSPFLLLPYFCGLNYLNET